MAAQHLTCSELRTALIGFMSEQTEVYDDKDSCVVTLPFKTVDDRWVDVYIEKRAADFFLVHDGGRTTSELVSHGVKITEAKTAMLNQIAKTYGAGLQDNKFLIGCKLADLQESIMGIAQCASLSTIELLKHAPSFSEEPLFDKLSETLHGWGTKKSTAIRSRIKIKGKTSQHEFDFVAYPTGRHNTIGLKILHPSYTPMITAQRFGFLSLDLKSTEYAKWKRLVVLARGDEWTSDSTALISKHASQVVRITSAEMEEVEKDIPSAMNKLLKVA